VSSRSLKIVLAAADQVTNEPISYDKIPLVDVLHCNIYPALKISKILFLFVKSIISISMWANAERDGRPAAKID